MRKAKTVAVRIADWPPLFYRERRESFQSGAQSYLEDFKVTRKMGREGHGGKSAKSARARGVLGRARLAEDAHHAPQRRSYSRSVNYQYYVYLKSERSGSGPSDALPTTRGFKAPGSGQHYSVDPTSPDRQPASLGLKTGAHAQQL